MKNPRLRFREILDGTSCVYPASVYDAMSTRMAEDMGFEAAMLGGSVAALVVLGVPDHTLLTLDEFAGLCRRICRGNSIPLIADADHGFGNALNAMRCVEELENAGVAAMTLEDTILPRPFGPDGKDLLSLAEAVGKIAAAVSARKDPTFSIIGRTTVQPGDLSGLTERTASFAQAGADAIFLTGARTVLEVQTVREATGLPILLAAAKGELEHVKDLASLGIRVCLKGHGTIRAAATAAWKSLSASRHGEAEAIPDNLLGRYSQEAHYSELIAKFLGAHS